MSDRSGSGEGSSTRPKVVPCGSEGYILASRATQPLDTEGALILNGRDEMFASEFEFLKLNLLYLLDRPKRRNPRDWEGDIFLRNILLNLATSRRNVLFPENLAR